MSSNDTVEALAKSMDEAVSEDKAKFEANVVAITEATNALAIAMMNPLFNGIPGGAQGLSGRNPLDAVIIAGAVIATTYCNVLRLLKATVAQDPQAPPQTERCLVAMLNQQMGTTLSQLQRNDNCFIHHNGLSDPQIEITPAGQAALDEASKVGPVDGEDASGS